MIIPEFIGYCIETAAIALWKSRPLRALRNLWPADQDRSETLVISLIAVAWLALCLAGVA